MVLIAEAPAKINRELRVGQRRPDGFHEIRSRFCAIDFCDRLEVEESDRLELSCSGVPVPCGDTNLVARAARALADRLGIASGARIRLEKRVPAGAGLGGGSADAAVTLLLLSKLWEFAPAARRALGSRGPARQRRPLLPVRRRSRRGRPRRTRDAAWRFAATGASALDSPVFHLDGRGLRDLRQADGNGGPASRPPGDRNETDFPRSQRLGIRRARNRGADGGLLTVSPPGRFRVGDQRLRLRASSLRGRPGRGETAGADSSRSNTEASQDSHSRRVQTPNNSLRRLAWKSPRSRFFRSTRRN